MEQVYTFVARDGSGTAASALPDGSNLPGGAKAWEHRSTIEAAQMDATLHVVGIGNAADVRNAVRKIGFFVSISLRED